MKDQILRMFAAGENSLYNYALGSPLCYGGHAYSSDAYSAIRVKSENNDYSENAYFGIELIGYFEYHDKIAQLILIENDFDKYKIREVIFDEIDCPECDGSGEVEADYSGVKVAAECPECNGIGVVEKKTETGNLIYDTIKRVPVVKILNTTISVEYLEKISKVSKLLNERIYILKSEIKNIIFQIGEYEIIVMGFMKKDTVDFEHAIINL